MKVWISNCALTKGIFEVEGRLSEVDEQCFITSERQVRIFGGQHKDWHKTKEAAIKKAEQMRVDKIKSLKDKIEKLEGMRFE